MADQLTTHFTLEEMTASQTAARLGIPNTADGTVRGELVRTAGLLEQVRAKFNAPLVVTSGYRSPALNAQIPGSATNSAHTFGRAADFICPGFGDPLRVCHAIADSPEIVFDQLIFEFASWTHIAVAAAGVAPRRQVLTIDRAGTRPGLPPLR